MASRENQGLQIALILFVIITIILGVVVYLSWMAAVNRFDEAKKAKDDAGKFQALNESYDYQVKILKRYVGFSQLSNEEFDDIRRRLKTQNSELWNELDAIDREYNKDMAKFDAAYTGEKNWRTLGPFLESVVRRKNVEIGTEMNRANTAETEKDRDVLAARNETQTAKDNLTAAKNQYDGEVAKFDDDRAQQTDKLNKLAADRNELEKRTKADLETKDSQIAGLDGQVQKLAQQNQAKNERIEELLGHKFEVADGRITWINQQTRTVWINLGLSDGLQRQTSFSVYDQDQSNYGEAVPKATIEVVQIMDRNLAEARILEDNISNPILPGDMIYTPTWVPGRKVRFALAGFVDYNEDGRSDAQMVRNLILLNGGEIDAIAVDDKSIEPFGRPTIHTRYLVVGEAPTGNPEALKLWNDMRDFANENGVEIVSVHKMLNWMGFRGEVRTVPLGKAAGAAEDKTFRPRRPMAPGTGKSY